MNKVTVTMVIIVNADADNEASKSKHRVIKGLHTRKKFSFTRRTLETFRVWSAKTK